MARRAGARPGREPLRRVALDRTRGAADDGRSRSDADRPRHASRRQESAGRRCATSQLDRGSVPDAGVGGSSSIRSSNPATRWRGYGACRDNVPARRSRSGRGVGAPAREPDGDVAGGSTSWHLDALRYEGPGHRADDRLLGSAEWWRRSSDRRRDRSCPQHPDRRGVHHARPRRVDGVVAATKPLFTSGALGHRPAGAVRARARGRDRR